MSLAEYIAAISVVVAAVSVTVSLVSVLLERGRGVRDDAGTREVLEALGPPPMPLTEAAAGDDETTVLAEPPARFSELELVGGLPGESWILEGDSVTIGRGVEADIRLWARHVSRVHARVERVGEDWYIVDLSSTNGVLVDGHRIERERLVDGACVQLGSVELRYRTVTLWGRERDDGLEAVEES